MTRRIRVPILIFTHVVILLVGLSVGFYYGNIRLGEARRTAENMLLTAKYSFFLETQMKEGTDAAYEEAIQGHLALLKDLKQNPDAILTDKVFAIDSALDYARLSALASKRGAAQEAKQLLARAEAFCPQIGWRECSAYKIQYFASLIDKRGLFGGYPK